MEPGRGGGAIFCQTYRIYRRIEFFDYISALGGCEVISDFTRRESLKINLIMFSSTSEKNPDSDHLLGLGIWTGYCCSPLMLQLPNTLTIRYHVAL